MPIYNLARIILFSVKLGIRNDLLSNDEAEYTSTIPTVVSSHQEGPATHKYQRARKSTPSSGLKTISSSGCTKVSESSTPTDSYTNNTTPEEEGPSPLIRSSRSSSELPKKSSNESSRRKSTQNTVGSSRPPPLAISPLIKTEPVDVNEGVVSSRAGVVSATFGTINGFTLTTPSEETEEDELIPNVLQSIELHNNELELNLMEIGALYFKRNTDTVSNDSTIHPPYNPNHSPDSTIHSPDKPSVSIAFTTHPLYNPSVSTASTKDPHDNPSVSTDSTIHSPDKPSVSIAFPKHPLDNHSVSTDSTIHPQYIPSVSTDFTVLPPYNPCVSTAFTELPSYETVRLPTDLTTANLG